MQSVQIFVYPVQTEQPERLTCIYKYIANVTVILLKHFIIYIRLKLRGTGE